MKFKMLKQSRIDDFLHVSLEIHVMLNVHCISTINSLEEDTVFIQYFMIVCTIYSLFCSFDQFHSMQYCFLISFHLDRACFTHLISSNLRSNLMFKVLWSIFPLEERNNGNVFCHSLWKYSKRFHCSFERHLTPHMTLSIETCLYNVGGHPLLGGH